MFFSFHKYILTYIFLTSLSLRYLSSLQFSLHLLFVFYRSFTKHIPPCLPYIKVFLSLVSFPCLFLSHTSVLTFTWLLFLPWPVSEPDCPAYLLYLNRTQEEPSTPLGLFSTTTLNQQEPYMVVPGLWTNWQKLKSQIPNWRKQSWPTARSWTLLMRSLAWCLSPCCGLLLKGVSTVWSSEVCLGGLWLPEQYVLCVCCSTDQPFTAIWYLRYIFSERFLKMIT